MRLVWGSGAIGEHGENLGGVRESKNLKLGLFVYNWSGFLSLSDLINIDVLKRGTVDY